MIETRRINVGDAEIHVELHGAGPEVFLVAGLGGRGVFWSSQISALAKYFRLIVHDHRGCGQSSRNKLVNGAEHMATDVIALMDALDIETAHLVGHSTGGAIGQHIALKWPHRLDKLALSCSWVGPDVYLQRLFELRRKILVDCGPEAYLVSGTYLANPGFYLQEEMDHAQNYLADRVAEFPGIEVELSRIKAVMDHDLRNTASQIRHQTLCIGAKDDQITPPGFTKELARLIPNSTYHLLSRGGHFCPIVSFDKYNNQLLHFLKGE